MIKKEEVYKIGVINKPHGIKGEVSLATSKTLNVDQLPDANKDGLTDINDIIEYYNNHMHLIKPFKATVESFFNTHPELNSKSFPIQLKEIF